MPYQLYVLIMKDGSWRLCPRCDGLDKQNTFYLTGSDTQALKLSKGVINTNDASVQRWEFVADVTTDKDAAAVQEALNSTERYDMHRPQDTPDVFKPEDSVGKLGDFERFGSWSQTFVILVLKRLEKEGVVKQGTVEEFKKKV